MNLIMQGRKVQKRKIMSKGLRIGRSQVRRGDWKSPIMLVFVGYL